MLAYRSLGTMLPSRQQKGIGTSEMPVSQLNTQPMVSPYMRRILSRRFFSDCITGMYPLVEGGWSDGAGGW